MIVWQQNRICNKFGRMSDVLREKWKAALAGAGTQGNLAYLGGADRPEWGQVQWESSPTIRSELKEMFEEVGRAKKFSRRNTTELEMVMGFKHYVRFVTLKQSENDKDWKLVLGSGFRFLEYKPALAEFFDKQPEVDFGNCELPPVLAQVHVGRAPMLFNDPGEEEGSGSESEEEGEEAGGGEVRRNPPRAVRRARDLPDEDAGAGGGGSGLRRDVDPSRRASTCGAHCRSDSTSCIASCASTCGCCTTRTWPSW